MDITQRITNAKVSLIFHQPWFGQLANYLTFYIDNNIQTMGITIEGKVFINETFVNSLSDKELCGVMCHEILHLAFQHLSRMEHRNPKVWNIAGDIKVNTEIIFNQDKFSLPKMAIIPYGNTVTVGKAKINNINLKTSEEIYKEIMEKNAPEDLQDLGTDTFIYSDGLSSDQIKEAANDWQEKVSIANEVCKDKGTIPAGLLREMKELDTPQLAWHQIIKQRLKLIAINKSWKKPNKKMMPWYFAGRNKVKGITCAICIDTSGSMSDDILKRTLTEIWGLSQQFKAIKFYIMSCDTDLTEPFIVDTRTKNKLMSIELKGGGGTDFRPVFKWVKENNIILDCLIYFTDLYGDFPETKPLFQTYWVTNSVGQEIPFGRLIKMKL